MKSRHRINPNTLRLARDLRSNQTATERLLWHALRNRNLKYKFRRQYPIDQYVVDFYCPRVKLCIEIDGGTHYEAGQEDYDIIRTAYLERLGYKVIRFTNDDVHKNINAVADGIVLEIEGIIAHE